MNTTPSPAELSLEALMTVMKFDGDIELSMESRNLCYKMGQEGDEEMWFVSLEIPTSRIEAFVVADQKGNFSYYDWTLGTLVINNVIIHDECGGSEVEYLDSVLDEYTIDGSCDKRPAKPGYIAAYEAALIAVGDGTYDR